MIAPNSSGKAVVVVCFIFPTIAALAIVARFHARKAKKLRLQVDDYVIVASWMVAAALAATYIAGVFEGGLGYTLEVLDLAQVTAFTKVLFAGQFLYLFTIGLVKVSIVLFYKRIFVTNGFKKVAWGLLVLIGMWLTAFFLTTLFQSWPISRNWTGVGENIMDAKVMYVALAASDLALDIIILVTPLPVIKNLGIALEKKLAIATLFGLGFLCIIASAIRLYYTNRLGYGPDNTFSSAVVNYAIWGQIEACWSIVCACLPTIGQLVQGARSPESIINSVRSVFSRKSADSLQSSKRKTSSEEKVTPPSTGSRAPWEGDDSAVRYFAGTNTTDKTMSTIASHERIFAP